MGEARWCQCCPVATVRRPRALLAFAKSFLPDLSPPPAAPGPHSSFPTLAAMARKDISFTAKDAALREDIHTLGALVGEVLRDQGGDAFFEEVEGDRQVAIRRRDSDPEAAVQLVVRADSRSAEQAAELIRAFGTWFQMVNMAEKVHRVRRRRQYLNDSSTHQPGGLAECFQKLRAIGYSLSQVVELLGRLSIEPVFTAHPTESTRRTLLRQQQRIARLLMTRLDPSPRR